MRFLTVFLLPALCLAACETSTDPADGGFFSGIQGISSGAYDARIEAAEADVATAQARNDVLVAQISEAESELAQLKLQIITQRNQIGQTDANTSARINRVLGEAPPGGSDQERLIALQQSISAARALSADLAELTS